MKEKKIFSISRRELTGRFLLSTMKLVEIGYKKTFNKFSVHVHGSKGYISHIEIDCEGSQTERNNILWFDDLYDKEPINENQKLYIQIFHSEKNGVRVELVVKEGNKIIRILKPSF